VKRMLCKPNLSSHTPFCSDATYRSEQLNKVFHCCNIPEWTAEQSFFFIELSSIFRS